MSEETRLRHIWGDLLRREGVVSDGAKMLAWEMMSYPSAKQMKCEVSRSKLAKNLSVEEKTIQRRVKELEQAGWITRQVGSGRGNWTKYQLVFPPNKGIDPAPLLGKEKKTDPSRKGDTLVPPYKDKPHINPQSRSRAVRHRGSPAISVALTPMMLTKWRGWLMRSGYDQLEAERLTTEDPLILPFLLPPDDHDQVEKRIAARFFQSKFDEYARRGQ